MAKERMEAGRVPAATAHWVLTLSTAAAAACALVLYLMRSSGTALQSALAVAGFCYGLTDTGITQLTLWRFWDDAKTQRTQSAPQGPL